MQKNQAILFILIAILLSINYLAYKTITGEAISEFEKVKISRVIDGDTIEINSSEGIEKIRLLGINTPEKDMPGYGQAKSFLKPLEDKEISITYTLEDIDKYGRMLRYAFYNNLFLNEEILKQGLANLYIYEEDKYTKQLRKVEESARQNQLGIWKKSENANCIQLIKLKYQEKKRCNNEEQLVLNNNCNTKINLILKDDANHISRINLENGLFSMNFSCVWNDAGDSLYAWDSEGLVLFYRY